jgi:uncharacterized protein YdiU (UPF0061 family)
MHDSRVDYTSLFRRLGDVNCHDAIESISLRNDFIDRDLIDQWFKDYVLRLRSEESNDAARKAMMNEVNPKYVLRNHLAQKAIELAQAHDFSEVKKLHFILQKPFDEQPLHESYALPPLPGDIAVEVSCSS